MYSDDLTAASNGGGGGGDSYSFCGEVAKGSETSSKFRALGATFTLSVV